MPTIAPPSPTYRCQPRVDACSIATRARTDGGSTCVAVLRGWRSNSSQHGMLTTRAPMPSPASSSRAASARRTSEPVAIRITSGSPASASAQHVAALATPEAGASTRCGRAWAGPGARGRAPRARGAAASTNRHVSATSFASAGRNTSRPGHRPQRGELLDRLMGRAVLADADRVVGEDVHDGDLHQRRQPDRRARVVGEDQEPATSTGAASSAPCRWRSPPTRARGHRGGGCARRCSGWKSPAPSNVSRVLVDGARSADAAHQPRDAPARRVEHLTDESRVASPFASAGKVGSSVVPAVRQLTPLDPLELVGQLGYWLRYSSNVASPRVARLAPRAPMPRGEPLVDTVGHVEVDVLRPAEEPLGRPITSSRRAARRAPCAVSSHRRAVPDVAVHDDQRRALVLGAGTCAAPAATASRSLASATVVTFQP